MPHMDMFLKTGKNTCVLPRPLTNGSIVLFAFTSNVRKKASLSLSLILDALRACLKIGDAQSTYVSGGGGSSAWQRSTYRDARSSRLPKVGNQIVMFQLACPRNRCIQCLYPSGGETALKLKRPSQDRTAMSNGCWFIGIYFLGRPTASKPKFQTCLSTTGILSFVRANCLASR